MTQRKVKPKLCTEDCPACEVLPEKDWGTFTFGSGCKKCICNLPGNKHFIKRLNLDRCPITKHAMEKLRTRVWNDMKRLTKVWDHRYKDKGE